MSIYQITAKGSYLTADQLRNVHHYEFFGYVPTPTELQEAVDAIDTAYKTHLRANFTLAVAMLAYDVRRVDVGDLPTVEFVATAGIWLGTLTGDSLPPQVSGLVTWKAQTPFPRSTRSYLWPMGEGVNDADGEPSPGALSDMADFADDMFSLVITAQIDADKQAVKYGGDPRLVVDSNDVDVKSIANLWATQRRRRRGVGA